MDIVDVELFLSIVKWNSITKASESMHFSQSTVSYRLKQLEKELGIPLFHRNKGIRTSELTRYGELFIPVAEKWRSVYQDTQELKYYPENMLTIGAIDSIGSSVLADVYYAVSEGERPLCLKIITAYSSEIYNLVENKTADIGFIVEPCKRKNVITKPLFKQKYYVVRYAKYPSAVRRINPKDLDSRYEIYMYWGGDYEAWHEQIFGESTLYHAWVDNVSLLQRFLTDEKYWAIIPGSLLQRFYLGTGNVQVDELELPQPYERTCYIIKHRQPKVSKMESLRIFEGALEIFVSQIPDLVTDF